MAEEKHSVAGDQRLEIIDQLWEIQRQLKQKGGCPWDPRKVKQALQAIIEGKFPRPWREENGVIYFSVTSDGTTGPEWIKRLEKKGFKVSDYAKSLLLSPDFKPTSGVKYEVAILKGMLFEDNDRITKKIRAEAGKRKFSKPNPEVACLIREMFTNEEIKTMGLVWIVAMHEPINYFDGDPGLLSAGRNDDGSWLLAFYGKPDGRWFRDGGFAFVASQVS